jgi:DNA-binding transcriptional LysR family regulator
LFDRTPEGLRITKEGKALLEAATHMEQSAQDFALRATVTDGDLDGVVRIATTELFACSFLVGALQRVREKHPGICVELVLSNTETDLLRREADIAVRFGPEASRPKPETLVARRLGNEPFLVYGADNYLRRRGAPTDPDDLSQHEVVVYSGRHPRGRVVREGVSRIGRSAFGAEHAGDRCGDVRRVGDRGLSQARNPPLPVAAQPISSGRARNRMADRSS